MTASPEKRRFFYGWVVLATAFLLMAVVGGGVYYAFGVFLKPMSSELGWSRGITSIAFSVSMITGALVGPFIGMAVGRFGPRKVLVVGNLLGITGLLLLSRINEPWHLYLVFGIVCGIAMGSEADGPAMAMVNNWFARRRALAMGITISGVGFGTVILAPVIRYFIEILGWRQAWLALAAVALVFSLIPALIFARNKPEDMSQFPDGVKLDRERIDAPIIKKAYNSPVDWKVKDAIRAPSLWFIVAFFGSGLFALNMLATHQVAHLEDIGISPITSAGALGLMVATSCIGRLIGGALGDRIKPRYLGAIAGGLQAIGLIVFMNASSLWLIYAYVIIYGISYGSLLVLAPAMLGAYFGRKNFATIQGIGYAPFLTLAALSPIIAGYVYDSVGSYFVPLVVATIICAAGGVCAFLAKSPRPPETR